MSPNSTDKLNTDVLTIFRLAVATVILMVGVGVALLPGLFFAPTPRVVLFCLIGLLPAILFGAESAARFELNFKSFSFVTFGAAAIAIATLVILSWLAKPDQQIAVFYVVDNQGNPVPGLASVNIPLTPGAYHVPIFVDGYAIILIFPEQVPEVMLEVKVISNGPTFYGSVKYTGNRQVKLKLGEQLKTNQANQ